MGVDGYKGNLLPADKLRVVEELEAGGNTVGMVGDGINDAAAMKAADVGISVDTAVDIAKESANIILMEKDLMVLEQGEIIERGSHEQLIAEKGKYYQLYTGAFELE